LNGLDRRQLERVGAKGRFFGDADALEDFLELWVGARPDIRNSGFFSESPAGISGSAATGAVMGFDTRFRGHFFSNSLVLVQLLERLLQQ